MPTKRIIVTGGSGKVGFWILKHLVEEGYDVVNVDTRRPATTQCRTIVADLTQLGQVITSFSPHGTGNRTPYDGVIHLAAIPRPHAEPNDEVFRVNSLATYNVLEACGLLGIKKAVVASSESSYGFAFADKFFDPHYLPIDEAHPQLPADTYGLTKIVNEATAAMFHRRDGTQILSLRIGNVICPEDYAEIKAKLSDPADRAHIFWSFIDSRDLAIACRLGIEKSGLGCEAVNLCADHTSSKYPSQKLIKRFFPSVKITHSLPGRTALLSNARVKKLLGWKPKYDFPI